MKALKKSLALFLAVLMIFSSISALAYDYFDDGYLRTLISRFKFVDEYGTEITKASPGQTIYARVHLGSDFPAGATNLYILFNNKYIEPTNVDPSALTISEAYTLWADKNSRYGEIYVDMTGDDTPGSKLISRGFIPADTYDTYGSIYVDINEGTVDYYNIDEWVFQIRFTVTEDFKDDAVANIFIPRCAKKDNTQDVAFGTATTNAARVLDTSRIGESFADTATVAKDVLDWPEEFQVEPAIMDGTFTQADLQGISSEDAQNYATVTYAETTIQTAFIIPAEKQTVTWNVMLEGETDPLDSTTTQATTADKLSAVEPTNYEAPFGYKFGGWTKNSENKILDTEGRTDVVLGGNTVTGTATKRSVSVNFYPPIAVGYHLEGYDDGDDGNYFEASWATGTKTAKKNPKTVDCEYGDDGIEVPDELVLDEIEEDYYLAGWTVLLDTEEQEYEAKSTDPIYNVTGSTTVMKAITQENYNDGMYLDGEDVILDLVPVILPIPTEPTLKYNVVVKLQTLDNTYEDGTGATNLVANAGAVPTINPDDYKPEAGFELNTTTTDLSAKLMTEGQNYILYFDRIKYQIDFVNDDGTSLKSTQEPFGATPVEPEKPAKESTVDKTFTFDGWDSEIVPVAGTKTYKAKYKEEARKYTVKFLDGDGSTLEEASVAYGTKPTAPTKTPTKAPDADYTYTFKEWSPAIAEVAGEATYTPVFDSAPRKYTVKWEIGDKTYTTEVLPGTKLTAYTVPAEDVPAGMEFDKWTDMPEEMPKADVTVNGIFKYIDYTIDLVLKKNADDKGTKVATIEGAHIGDNVADLIAAYLEENEIKVPAGYEYEGMWESDVETMQAENTTAYSLLTPGEFAAVYYVGNSEKPYESYDIFVDSVIDEYPNTDDFEEGVELPDGYEFVGWSTAKGTDGYGDPEKAVNPEDMTMTADGVNFYAILQGKSYEDKKIKFDANGGKFESGDSYVEVGGQQFDAAVVTPTEEPTKDGSNFGGWALSAEDAAEGKAADLSKLKQDLDDLSSPLTFYAIWTPDGYTHKVTYYVNGSIYDTNFLEYGETIDNIKVDGKTVTWYTDDVCETAATNWTMGTENVDLYTTVADEKITVKFDPKGGKFSDDSTAAVEKEFTIGEEITYEDPTKVGYEFLGWDAVSDTLYEAIWSAKEYDVVFKVGDDSETIKSIFGEDIEFPAEPDVEGYTFDGWYAEDDTEYKDKYEDGDKLSFTEEPEEALVLVAKMTAKKYLITFVDDDGKTVLKEEEVKYGTKPTAPADPSKDATAQYTYEFAGWDKEIVEVTGEATYTATYDATVRKYDVKFVDDNGTTVLGQEEVEYGTKPTAPADPTKPADAQYTYEFAGWDKEVVEVTGEATYTATYKKTTNKYMITFNDADGNVYEQSEVEYGTKPTAPVKNPTKEADEEFTYEFKGWDPELTEVTGVATYSPVFEAVPIVHEVITKLVAIEGKTAMVERDGVVETYNDITADKAPYGVTSVIDPFSDTYGEYSSDDYQTWYVYGLKRGLAADKLADYVTVTGEGYYELENVHKSGKIGTGTIIKVYDKNGNFVEQFYIIIYGDIGGDGNTNDIDATAAWNEFDSGNATWSSRDDKVPYIVRAADLDQSGKFNDMDANLFDEMFEIGDTPDQITGRYSAE